MSYDEHCDKRLAHRLRRQARRAPNNIISHTHSAAAHEHHHDQEGQHNFFKDQLMRTQAEFDNFRKRTRREAQQIQEQANKDLLEALLPVLDNFERAVQNPGDSVDALLNGIEMVQKQLLSNLEQYGLQRVDAKGQPFDPNVHEAVATGPADDQTPDNHILDVMQPGYTLNGKLVRPAMVRVARA